ncbi:hypothetical protein SVAN01_11108 [Stagonosporopsis vannaccii]|nr:hypothetical protein SVAN01_11108 [Stagonosporopsis vannaccii]
MSNLFFLRDVAERAFRATGVHTPADEAGSPPSAQMRGHPNTASRSHVAVAHGQAWQTPTFAHGATGHSSPPSPSQRSAASQVSTTPPPLDLTPFGETLGDYLIERIGARFNHLYEQTSSHADFRRRGADYEFLEQLGDERLALNREAESTSEVLKRRCEDLKEDVIERVHWRLEEMSEVVEKHSGAVDFDALDGLAYGSTGLRRKRARLRRKSADLSLGEEELRNERAVFIKKR